MKKIVSMLLIVALTLGAFGSVSFAAGNSVDIWNEKGIITVTVGGKTSKASSSTVNNSVALGLNSSGQLLVSWYKPDNKVKTSNMKISPSEINLHGKLNFVNLASTLENIPLNVKSDATVSKLNNRSSEIKVESGSTVGKLVSISDLPMVIDGVTSQLHVRSTAGTVELNGKSSIARAEGGASINVNGEVLSLQALNKGEVSVQAGARVNGVSSNGGTVSVLQSATLRDIEASNSTVNIEGDVTGRLSSKGSTNVSIKSGAKVKNLTAIDSSKVSVDTNTALNTVETKGSSSFTLQRGAVANEIRSENSSKLFIYGNITGTLFSKDTVEISTTSDTRINNLESNGSSTVSLVSGSFVKNATADYSSSITADRGSEIMNFYALSNSRVNMSGSANSLTCKENADVVLNDGSKVSSLNNTDSIRNVTLKTGSIIGAVTDNKRINSEGGRIDSSIMSGVVTEKPVDPNPTAMPSFSATATPAATPTATATPTPTPTPSLTIPVTMVSAPSNTQLMVTMPQMDGLSFKLTGYNYNGSVYYPIYNTYSGMYTLTLSSPLQPGMYYTLTVSKAGYKDYVNSYIMTSLAGVNRITVLSNNGLVTINQPRGSLQLIANVEPISAPNRNVLWSVSDPYIASISATGLLTAIKDGTLTVTATATDGSGVRGSMVVYITNQNSASINEVSLTYLNGTVNLSGTSTSMEYSTNLNSSFITCNSSVTYLGPEGTVTHVTIRDKSYNSSTKTFASQGMSNVTARGITKLGANDGEIDVSGTSSTGFEYMLPNSANWTPANLNNYGDIIGLAAGSYKVRTRGTSTVLPSTYTTVTILEPLNVVASPQKAGVPTTAEVNAGSTATYTIGAMPAQIPNSVKPQISWISAPSNIATSFPETNGSGSYSFNINTVAATPVGTYTFKLIFSYTPSGGAPTEVYTVVCGLDVKSPTP